MTSIEHLDDTQALQRLVGELSVFNPAKKIDAIHRSILFKERAPHKQLLQVLKDRNADVRAAAAEAVEALQEWITDEQWLEALQENTGQASFAAINILVSLGKDAPFGPLVSPIVLRNRAFRSLIQPILRLKISQYSLKRQEELIQLFCERLQHRNPEHRIIVLEMLGLMDDKVPIEIFLPTLKDSDVGVRLATLQVLRKRGQQGSALPIELLADLLSDPDGRIRRASLVALDTQKEDLPVHLLIAAMHDSDEGIIHTAINILGSRRVIQAIPELMEQLLNDPNDFWMDYTDSAVDALCELYAYIPLERLLSALSSAMKETRLRAIALLSLLQERTPLELLLKLLDDKDPAIRMHTIGALSCHLARIPKEAIVNKLKDRNRAVRKVASIVLLRENGDDIPVDLLLPFLNCPENIARATAITLLNKRVPMARLLAATHDQKWTVRKAAIEVLGTMGKQVSLEVFLEALCDRNLSVRATAILALGEQGERAPVPIIIDALHDRKRVSEVAGEVLEKLGKLVPHELVVQALDDPMAHIRRIAIHLLQAIEYEEAFPSEKMRGMIQDPEASVREAAILALNQLGVIEPAEPFIAALNDSNDDVRKAALLVLAKLGKRAPQDQLKALLTESEIYRDAIECLQKTHPEVLREVAEEASNILLGKGAGQVLGSLIQADAAEIIGNMHNPGPLLVNRLFELLNWPYESVRRKAEQALHRLGKEPVRPARECI